MSKHQTAIRMTGPIPQPCVPLSPVFALQPYWGYQTEIVLTLH